jgi:hypothetical protein
MTGSINDVETVRGIPGISMKAIDGDAEGTIAVVVGWIVGLSLGPTDGDPVGLVDGILVGEWDGRSLGDMDGVDVGGIDGALDSVVGAIGQPPTWKENDIACGVKDA